MDIGKGVGGMRIVRGLVRKIAVIAAAYVAGVFLILGVYTGIAECNGLDYSYTFVYTFCPVLKIKDSGNIILPEPHGDGDYDTPAGSYGPVVVIDELCWEDTTFLEHEMVHARQRYRLFFIGFQLLYTYSERDRIFFEYEAFKAENRLVSDEEIALQLSLDVYGNGLSKEQILVVISSYRTVQFKT